MNIKKLTAFILSLALLTSCSLGLSSRSKWSEEELYSAVVYEVNVRQYTKDGTFKAFSEHLPRLKTLGVDVLWFMPIHPISEVKRKGSLGSYYAIKDYYGINPEFGTKQDFKDLVNQAHELGFKVILDWVANHSGWDNEWVSKHPDWYTQVNGQIIHPQGTDWTDVADFNYNNQALRKEMIKAMKYWVTDFDVDGFRADVAGSVPVSFWEDATLELEKVKPLFMLAEDDSNPRLLDYAFDSNYQFRFYSIMKDVANNRRGTTDILAGINNIRAKYKDGIFPFIYTTNHDENSWDNPLPIVFKDATKAMNLLIFTMPGMPLIYSGQEINSSQKLAFFDKDEIIWGDALNNLYHKFYEQLTALKKNNSALWHKDNDNFDVLKIENDILYFVRSNPSNEVLVLINLSDKASAIEIDLKASYLEYFSGVRVADSLNVFNLDPWGYQVLIKQP